MEKLKKNFKYSCMLFVLWGIILVLYYCANLNFYPSGISLNDTFLFVYVTFSFFMVYFITFLLVTSAFFWVFHLFLLFRRKFFPFAIHRFDLDEPSPPLENYILSKIRPIHEVRFKTGIQPWGYWFMSFPVFCLLLAMLYTLYKYNAPEIKEIGSILTGFLLGGFGFLMMTCVESAPDRSLNENIQENMAESRLNFRFVAFLVIFLTPMFMGAGKFLVNSTMEIVGIRFEGVPVQVSEENYISIIEAAQLNDIPVLGCRIGNLNSRIVYGIDTLWSGAGNIALARLSGNEIDAQVRVNNKGYSPISTKSNVSPCLQLDADTLFSSGSSVLKSETTPELVKFKESILKLGKIKSAIVVGHADPMPLKNSDNLSLSYDRAVAVKEWLMREFELSDGEVEARGEGIQKLLVDCPRTDPTNVQRLCNAPNRRVEILVRMRP
ncbi:OOP family OmpA-OmpF porin [Skermanella aerolata]|uniref:OmpA family protein n=1 Tax=Skermanella aerolata TaxID=393310 RepID=UPI003D1F7280